MTLLRMPLAVRTVSYLLVKPFSYEPTSALPPTSCRFRIRRIASFNYHTYLDHCFLPLCFVLLHFFRTDCLSYLVVSHSNMASLSAHMLSTSPSI